MIRSLLEEEDVTRQAAGIKRGPTLRKKTREICRVESDEKKMGGGLGRAFQERSL